MRHTYSKMGYQTRLSAALCFTTINRAVRCRPHLWWNDRGINTRRIQQHALYHLNTFLIPCITHIYKSIYNEQMHSNFMTFIYYIFTNMFRPVIRPSSGWCFWHKHKIVVKCVSQSLHNIVCLFVCFPGVTTHCGCIFHSPVAGFSLLSFEASWSHTTTRHSR
jgi:hypothetical protein